jgi:hypothetical protein
MLATRLAQVTGKARWISLRDKILDLMINSQQWDAAKGTYFLGDFATDSVVSTGAYAAGARIQSPFQLALLVEAFDMAYRATGRQVLRDRIISIARFVDQYGLDPNYQYTASFFGIVNGTVWHRYSATQPVTFWDPVYTTSLVNTLVRGYKFSGDAALYARAKYFFNRGTKGVYGSPTQRTAADNVVDHFVDTRFATSTGNLYLEYNKGELQYTYLIFENGGRPTVETGTTTDTTAPIISSVRASNTTTNQTTIVWSTNEASDSQIEYGLTTAYGQTSTVNATQTTAHSATVSGLTPGTTYNYRVRSKDAAGNLAVSLNFTFTTASLPVAVSDTTPPTVVLTSPRSGTRLSGTVQITAAASDNVGVVGVQFQIDDIDFGPEDTVAPYTIPWNTKISSDTQHKITAVARDAAGNRSIATMQVKINNRNR